MKRIFVAGTAFLFAVTILVGTVLFPIAASAASWTTQTSIIQSGSSIQSSTITSSSSSTSTVSTSTTSTATATPEPGTLQQCLKYQGHVYEVCYAYIVNSSLGALLPYYAYAHSGNLTAGKIVSNHLEKRYVGQARQVVVERVRGLPRGKFEIGLPFIKIVSVSSDGNNAQLTTEETWQVHDQAGNVVYQENGLRHQVSMQRVPSYVLHKWVVSSLQ